MPETDILKELKEAEKKADRELIDKPIFNELVQDLLTLDDSSDTKRRDKIIQMIETRKDSDEI